MPRDNRQKRLERMQAALDRHEKPLVRFSARIVGDLERGREVVQEAFARLWQSDDSSLPGRPAKWLYSVCRNLSIDIRRRDRRSGASGSVVDVESLESPVPSPANLLEREERRQSLFSLVGTLTKDQQKVVRLRFEDGLSYREIAATTGLSVSNVGFLLHTALKQIRAKLGQKTEMPRRGREDT